MKVALEPKAASFDDIDRHSRSLSPRLERLLHRIFQGDQNAKCDDPVGTDPPMLSRFVFTNALVAIFAPDGPEARQMKSDIEDAGGTAMIIPLIEVPEVWLRSYAARLACCIVGHNFEDADAAISFCLRLRFIAPELVTILTLQDVKTHDFSGTRMPICDVTLRRPVSRVPLFLGLQAARENRAAYDDTRGPIA